MLIGMTVTSTQVAAALVALGFRTRLSFSQCVEFEFDDNDKVKEVQQSWRETDARVIDPNIVVIRHVQDAREWIVKQVIHGNHNPEQIASESSFTTGDINLASVLVASNIYLEKLDRTLRLFYFPRIAITMEIVKQYEQPDEGSDVYYQVRYLKALNWLLRCIREKKVTKSELPN